MWLLMAQAIPLLLGTTKETSILLTCMETGKPRCFGCGPFHLGSYRPLTSYLPLIYRALLNSWEATVSTDVAWRKQGIKILQSLVISRVGLDLLQSCLTFPWLAATIPTACFFLSLKRNYIAFYLFGVCLCVCMHVVHSLHAQVRG